MHGSSPSAQARTGRLFKGHTCGVGVKQHVRITRLDVDVAPLFGYDIQQSDPAIAVGLANHLKVPCGLLTNAAAVGGDSRLRTLVADLALCNVGSDVENGCGNATASSIDRRCVGDDRALVAVECRSSNFDSGYS